MMMINDFRLSRQGSKILHEDPLVTTASMTWSSPAWSILTSTSLSQVYGTNNNYHYLQLLQDMSDDLLHQVRVCESTDS